MNKKEVSEIKRLFSSRERSPVTRIRGCFVDTEKNKKMESKDAFITLDEEEQYKYWEIFKKSLSGTLGKNLLNLSFPEDQEKEGGSQPMLDALVTTELRDDALAEDFFDKIIQSYEYIDNYYIILIHNAYDVPKITTDEIKLEDASDYVYNFIMCCVCPVKPGKGGLKYNPASNIIENCVREMMVDPPEQAFLYPAFNDRNRDIHHMLYYTKNAEKISSAIMEDVLGCVTPYGAKEQKNLFNATIEKGLGDQCQFDTVRALHNNIADKMAGRTEEEKNAEPEEISENSMVNLLRQSGVDDDGIENFRSEYKSAMSSPQPVLLNNVVNNKKFTVNTPDVTVTVNPMKTDLVETRLVDGVPCLVVELTDKVQVDGIDIHLKDLPQLTSYKEDDE